MSRILVVDDDDTIRETLYDLLSEEHTCQISETAEKALAKLDAEAYDVVLTDISMPGLSGVELLRHIRQRFADTPVIMISGNDDREHVQGLIKQGAFDFLMKPFTLEKVETTVKRALEYRNRLLEDSIGKPSSERETDRSESGDWKIVKEDPS